MLDSMQLTAAHKVATPANWKQGGDVIITAGRFERGSGQNLPGLQNREAVPAHDRAAEVK